MRYLTSLLLPLFLCTCGPAPLDAQTDGQTEVRTEATLDLNNLTLLAEMPDELEEISGLSIQGSELLAVEDENGRVYRLRLTDGVLHGHTEFWKDGDYEGIEAVGDEVWVVKSTGTLYRILNQGTERQTVEKFNTWLTGDNDVEGLGYDATRNRLLLACKTDARDDGRPKEDRYVFAFDLTNQVLGEEAVYTIDRGKELEDFAPSALAVDPRTGEVYLTSSVGNQLLVLTAEGTKKDLYELDKNLLPQAEGLAVGSDGVLYLSTEAKGGKPASIYRLPLRP